MNEDSITEIFCDVDDFCKALENYCKSRLLPEGGKAPKWFPASRLSLSEVMTIILLFHLSGYRCFKWYYQRVHMRDCFPCPVSYNRFVELTGCALLPLLLYTQGFRRGTCTGIGFIDSTPLKVCHNRRIYSHKVFKMWAARGKSSTGWFYGFKLRTWLSTTAGKSAPFALRRATLTTGTLTLSAGCAADCTGSSSGTGVYLAGFV